MQKLISFFLLSSILLFSLAISSCNKDDDSCSAPTLTDNIVGKWKVATTNSIAEFKSDGTIVDIDDVIISGESNGMVFNVKTYTIVNEETMKAKAATETGNLFAEVEFSVTKNECNVITFSLPTLGVSMDLTRQ